MDSLTQFALGAAVSAAVLGKQVGPRKAALIGGLLGTLPDLDALIAYDDPIDSFVYHRGWTHSVSVHAVAAPVIGEGVSRLVASLRKHRFRVYGAVFLCLSTHALLDAMTIYGTRLFWPFYRDPVGVGSVFIIDPLYTLPLLAVVIWALCKPGWSSRLGAGIAVALIVSTAYLGLSAGLQALMKDRAEAVFAEAGLSPERMLATPAPFNIVLWKVIGLEDERYHNVYLSLLDRGGQARLYTHPRRADLLGCLAKSEAVRKLEWFSRGYYRAEEEDGKVIVSDLRMGLTPAYAFRFAVGELTGGRVAPRAPQRDAVRQRAGADDLEWLWARLKGQSHRRVAEASGTARADTSNPGVSCGPALARFHTG